MNNRMLVLFVAPAITTVAIVIKFNIVKELLNLVEFLTPNAAITENAIKVYKVTCI